MREQTKEKMHVCTEQQRMRALSTLGMSSMGGTWALHFSARRPPSHPCSRPCNTCLAWIVLGGLDWKCDPPGMGEWQAGNCAVQGREASARQLYSAGLG